MTRHSSTIFVIQWVNIVALTLSVAVLGMGVLLATTHGNCEKFLATPVLITGGFIMCISLIGFVGAVKEITFLLWVYLSLVCLLLCAMAGFTLFTFIATHHGGSRTHPKEVGDHDYNLKDYSSWLQNLLNDRHNWEHFKSCFVKPKYCNDLKFQYKTLQAYKVAVLNPIEAGCCRPPSKCGYSPLNATYYDLQAPSLSSDNDCKIYKNNNTIKCYDCNSCKGVIAHYLRKDWRIIALINIILFTMLIVLYTMAYCTQKDPLKSTRAYS